MRRFPLTFLLLMMIIAVGAGLGLRSDGVDAQGAGGQAPDVMTDVIIAFDSAPGAAEEALVRAFGGTVSHTYHLVPAIAATVPAGAVQGLRNHPSVSRIDPDGEVHADDAELDNAWGVERIGSGDVHASGNTGAGIKVVVIDTGIDYTHPDLNDNYAGGYDFVNKDANPMDDQGHGTHVSGTIAAEDDNAGVVGVAPAAVLYAVKALNSSGSGSWSNIIAAMQWAVDNGMQVANLSLGASSDPGPTVQAAFDNAAVAGVVIVASAGNSGNPKGKGDRVGYPAKYASVIAVAATTSSDARASYSSTGRDLDVAAPGSSVNSTLLGGGYGTKSGTSMASPHVAGTAALVLASGTAPAAVRGVLQSTADDLGDSGFDTLYGHGLVNAAAAVGAPAAPPNNAPEVTITSPADDTTFDSGATISFTGTASDTEDGNLAASLLWTSSIDGAIGADGSFDEILTEGVHTITASVTDSGGATSSASVSITVGNLPEVATTVSATGITYATSGGKNGDKNLRITVALLDGLGAPVEGASVSIQLTLVGSGSWNGTASTGADGEVTFQLRNAKKGTYTTEVTGVTAAGLAWDGSYPENSFTK